MTTKRFLVPAVVSILTGVVLFSVLRHAKWKVNEQVTSTVIRITMSKTDGYIRHCITNEIVGKKPSQLGDTVLFERPQEKSSEDSAKRRASFDDIFKNKKWIPKDQQVNKELASGPGSTLDYSQEVIAGLHMIINQLKVQLGVSRIRLLDIPCGDMVWMSRFLRTRDDIDYTGVDIVFDLISRHNKTYQKYNWTFLEWDVVRQPLDKPYDLILCRMMLQHLFLNDALNVLKHISISNSRFLLTTSFFRAGGNGELPQNNERFRQLNLLLPPFTLIPPVCVMRDGDVENPHGLNHFLGLWELPLSKLKLCNSTVSFVVQNFNVVFISCAKWS